MRQDSKLHRYGALNTHDGLKLLALAFMTVDHIGWVAYPDDLWWRAIGRGGAPLFFFLIGHSRSYTIGLQLIVAALILTAVNTSLSHSLLNINVLVSFIIARLLLAPLEDGRIPLKRPWEGFFLLAVLFPTAILFHYGTLGLMFSYIGYLQKHPDRYRYADRIGILIASLMFYGGLELYFYAFPALECALAAISVAFSGLIIWYYRLKPLSMPLYFKRFSPLLLWISRYSLWLYVVQLVAIQLLTGIYY